MECGGSKAKIIQVLLKCSLKKGRRQ